MLEQADFLAEHLYYATTCLVLDSRRIECSTDPNYSRYPATKPYLAIASLNASGANNSIVVQDG